MRYTFHDHIGLTLSPFAITGSRNSNVFDGNGLPNSNGLMGQVDYTLWPSSNSPLGSRVNSQIGVQFTAYGKFNGAQHNFDGNGADAGNSNALESLHVDRLLIRRRMALGAFLDRRRKTMHDPAAHDSRRFSRRSFLRIGVSAGTGAVLASVVVTSPAASATAKVSKQTASYQASPKGGARCGLCAFFQAPSSCDSVDGSISPTGWCMLFRAKG